MKIACLTPFPNFLPQGGFNQRLEEEFLSHGHIYVRISPQEETLKNLLNDHTITLFDHVFDKTDEKSWHLIDSLRAANRPILRPARLPAGDKITMTNLFTQASLPIPQTFICHSLEETLSIAQTQGYPLVGKAKHGERGETVRLIQNREDMQAFVTMAQTYAPSFILQEAIQPLGQGIRLFMLNNQCIAATRREGDNGDFRAINSIHPLTPTAEEIILAQQACQLYGVLYAGIDIMRSAKGPILIELNKGPGLAQFEKISGVNVAAQIVEYWEKRLA